jgi:hypothetical protein
MRCSLALCVLFIGSAVTLGQLSPDDALKRLQEKQAARQAERQAREKIVGIKQGELDDLRAELASLKAQLAQIRAAVPGATPIATAAPKIEPVRVLAVGETREQVVDYIRRHPNEFELLTDTVATPHTLSRTTISSIQRQGSNAVDPKASANVTANQTEDVKARERTVEEGDKTETLVFMRNANLSVETGTHDEYNGVSHFIIHDHQKQWVPVEKLFIHIVEGSVTSIDREAVATPNRSAVIH